MPSTSTPLSQLAAEIETIHKDYRIACMNTKYYGRRLAARRQLYRGVNFTAALSATLAVVKGLQGSFEIFFQGLAAFSAIAALVRTSAGFEKELERYTKLFVTYGDVTAGFRRIEDRITVTKTLDEHSRTRVRDLRKRVDELHSIEDPSPKKKLLDRCQTEVESEIPATSLYWPLCDVPVATGQNNPISSSPAEPAQAVGSRKRNRRTGDSAPVSSRNVI
jgi:hypothetical protein